MLIYPKERKLLVDTRTESLIKEYAPNESALDAMADFFSGLGDQTRIKILSALSISSLCVNDISEVLGINQTTVSHQLRNLKNVGMVKVKRQGKVAFYSIADSGIVDMMNSAAGFI